jgi:glycerol-3-phosphate O-acyltransferase/dihydroxyacetone phosphate acyltransferase
MHRFGRAITVDEYMDDYLSGDEDRMRSAAKRITQRIKSEWLEITINADDWDTLFAARMARDLLWDKPRSINLDDFVSITQT